MVPVTGLLSFLHLVSTFPWSASPLLVDPAGEVGAEARRKMRLDFEAKRAEGAGPALYLATPRDLHASRW